VRHRLAWASRAREPPTSPPPRLAPIESAPEWYTHGDNMSAWIYSDYRVLCFAEAHGLVSLELSRHARLYVRRGRVISCSCSDHLSAGNYAPPPSMRLSASSSDVDIPPHRSFLGFREGRSLRCRGQSKAAFPFGLGNKVSFQRRYIVEAIES